MIPPYNIDLEKYGFPLKEIPNNLKSAFDGSMTMKQLGHIWYSDWSIGNFVKNIEDRYPESLFIFVVKWNIYSIGKKKFNRS